MHLKTSFVAQRTMEGKLMISKVIKEGSCFCRACNSELATNLLKTELANSNSKLMFCITCFSGHRFAVEIRPFLTHAIHIFVTENVPSEIQNPMCSYTVTQTIQFLRLWIINLFFCLLKRNISAGHARAK